METSNQSIDYNRYQASDLDRRKQKELKKIKNKYGSTIAEQLESMNLSKRELELFMDADGRPENIKDRELREKMIKSVTPMKLEDEVDNSPEAVAERNARAESAEEFNKAKSEQWKHVKELNPEQLGRRRPAETFGNDDEEEASNPTHV